MTYKTFLYFMLVWVICVVFSLLITPHYDPLDLNHDGRVGIEDWSMADGLATQILNRINK